MNKILICCAIVVGICASAASWAQNYPHCPIRIVAPTAPRGGLDVYAPDQEPVAAP